MIVSSTAVKIIKQGRYCPTLKIRGHDNRESVWLRYTPEDRPTVYDTDVDTSRSIE